MRHGYGVRELQYRLGRGARRGVPRRPEPVENGRLVEEIAEIVEIVPADIAPAGIAETADGQHRHQEKKEARRGGIHFTGG